MTSRPPICAGFESEFWLRIRSHSEMSNLLSRRTEMLIDLTRRGSESTVIEQPTPRES